MADSVIGAVVKKFKAWIVAIGALLLTAGEGQVVPFDPPGWALLVLLLVNFVVVSVLLDALVGGTLLGFKSALSD